MFNLYFFPCAFEKLVQGLVGYGGMFIFRVVRTIVQLHYFILHRRTSIHLSVLSVLRVLNITTRTLRTPPTHDVL